MPCIKNMPSTVGYHYQSLAILGHSVATKLRRSSKLRRFLSEDPSLSSSSVHFQVPKILGRRLRRFFGKIYQYFGQNCLKKSKNMYFA